MPLRRVLRRFAAAICLLLTLPLLPAAPAAALVPGSEASLTLDGATEYVGFGRRPRPPACGAHDRDVVPADRRRHRHEHRDRVVSRPWSHS